MSKHALDFLFASVLSVGCVLLWFVADEFRGINTDFWPKIILVTGAVLSACIAVQNALAWSRNAQKAEKGGLLELERSRIVRMAGMAALVLVYFMAFDRVGFLLATVIFLWIAAIVLPGGRMVTKIVFAPLFTIGLTVIFSRALGLPLPRGEGVFYQFNLMLY